MIIIVDNYDSFTFNLVHYCRDLGAEVQVVTNDALSPAEILASAPAGLILSPGPGRPEAAGVTLSLIEAAADRVPILGVCLGHQAIGMAFGGSVHHAPTVMHGKTSNIHHTGQGVFADLPTPFRATRYHSLSVDPETFPACLEVTAHTYDHREDGPPARVIMGLRHRSLPIEGIQFHPEAILTEHGHALLRRFLDGLRVPRPKQGSPSS